MEALPTVAVAAHNHRLYEKVRKERHARLGFTKHLRDVYGNEIRAMRRALSYDGHSVNFMGLRKYCRQHDIKLGTQDIWLALDRDRGGTITIEKLAPSNAIVLAQFQRWATSNPFLGTCAAIWESP